MYVSLINQYKEKIIKFTPPPLSLSEIDKRNHMCIDLKIFDCTIYNWDWTHVQ